MPAAFLFWLLIANPAMAKLTILAPPPDWRVLDRYQNTLTRSEFESRLPLYSPDGSIYNYLDVSDALVRIYSDKEKQNKLWELPLASSAVEKRPYTPVEKAAWLRKLSGGTDEKPLLGVRICLDPGHIGGEWANIEERRFRIGNGPPVEEGELNYTTCRLIEPLLKEAGAEVVWTRQLGVPVTPLRPGDLLAEGIEMMWQRDEIKARRQSTSGLLKLARWYSELMFYRVAEIRARSEIIGELKPDLTLCIHYNAAAWGRRPRLMKTNKIVIFVHGGYLANELVFDDMKFVLFSKLLERTEKTEQQVADAIGGKVVDLWGYPPADYADSPEGAVHTGTSPYVWARNLMASRLYQGPVVFVEGPYMNDRQTYPRLIAGDYDGEREFAGKKCRSIYREYAEIVAQGVIDAYRESLEMTKEKCEPKP